jgi:hypothetical protein
MSPGKIDMRREKNQRITICLITDLPNRLLPVGTEARGHQPGSRHFDAIAAMNNAQATMDVIVRTWFHAVQSLR